MATNKNNITPTINPTDKALDLFAEMMINRIKEMKESNWSKPWFCAGSGMWATNLDGREYNGQNALMLALCCQVKGYDKPVFVTHDRVNSLNWTKDAQGKSKRVTGKDGTTLPFVHVLKGEKSFPVMIKVFSCVEKTTKERISYQDYKNLKESDRENYHVYPSLRTYYVFNIEQTNIKEARPELYAKVAARYEQPKTVNAGGYRFAAVDKMIAENLWVCPIKPTRGDNAYYSLSQDHIIIPEYDQFRDGESFYSNLFHEMAHSTGAESRLNRLGKSSYGSPEYGTEELVAELTAALVSSRYGIEKHVNDDSASYLKCWLGSLNESPEYIKSVLNDVKNASYMLADSIDEVNDKINAVAAA